MITFFFVSFFVLTAVADYVAFNTTVTFPVGQTSIRFPVNFVNDNIFELPESLRARLTIESGNGVQVGLNNIATINITDNDGKVVSQNNIKILCIMCS